MKCGQRHEKVREGECVLTQPAITITIPDAVWAALRERAYGRVEAVPTLRTDKTP